MESNGAVQEIPEKRKKRKVADLDACDVGSTNVGTNTSIRICTNPNSGAPYQHRNRKKIIKLKNRKIEDLFVIRNFLPICEEFLVKHHESIFSNLLPKQEEEKDKTKGKGKSLQAITKGEPGQDESELDKKPDQLEQTRDHKGGETKEKECVRRKAKRKKKSKSGDELGAGSQGEDHLGEGSESVDDLWDGPPGDSEKGSATNGSATNGSAMNGSAPNRSHSNLHRTNLYRKYAQHTKQCLREMDLPFDRAVLLNVVDKEDNTSKIMKIVNKKKVISAFGDTWECMIEHIISLKEHKNLMKIYDIYDDDKNFYMIMEKLYGKELFNFLVYKKQVKESVCKYILSQILQAVNYLHHHNIIHRDIKPENLMFRNKKRKDKTYEYNYELVLIDFDTCQFLHPPSLGRLPGLSYPPGTANLRRTVSPSSSTERRVTPSECAKMCKHGEVRKMEQKKGDSPGEMPKGCVKSFSERRTKGKSTHERSGTSNLCQHSGRQQPRTKSSSGKKHMKLVGTYGYIAPEIIKGYNYSILSDMWSIGIIFYILMTGITPLPMCLMVNYKDTKDIILKKEKKGINFSLLSFNSYPLARDLCEKLLQFDPAERMPNSVIASHHPWLRYFNILGTNINLCASERKYLTPSHLSQNTLHDGPYVKNKRPRYGDRNCHVILPYHMQKEVNLKEDLPPFLPLSNEQRYYYFINQRIRNYYAVRNGILPHPGLSTSLERFSYLRGGNLSGDKVSLCGDTLLPCGDKVIATSYSVENDFEGKTHAVNYYQDRDSRHPPRISHQFVKRHNAADHDGDNSCVNPCDITRDGGRLHPAEGMASVRHAQKMRRPQQDEEEKKDEEDEEASSAQRRRPLRRKAGKILTNVKGRVTGAALHGSEKGNYGTDHRYILTQQHLRSRDDDRPLTGSRDPISLHPDEESTPDCNNFVDLFEHLIEKKKKKFTMTGKPLEKLPSIEKPFPDYYVPNDEQIDGTRDGIGGLLKRKEHTTTEEEKDVEYIRTQNVSELFSSPPMCIIPQNDPMKIIQIDEEYKRAYDSAPPKRVYVPNSHLALPHRGEKPNVILVPQKLSPSLLPLVYHHCNGLRNSIVLNDKGHLTNSSDDLVGVINSDRHSNTYYANVAANAYDDPCKVTNLYETSTSLNEAQEEQVTLQEGQNNGMHSQHDGLNAKLARTGTRSKVSQNGAKSKIPQNGAKSMFSQNGNMPPIYVNYRRANKNNIEIVPTMFRQN
ncbi:CAMK protein kinase [Plasmodium inui San Antonio 1]|uniref:CAMK protein kinase n=1 Tax=Plasmodium inui San Antonio 1 TaxID=1237626 RepID=W7A8R7_9APIC|nr:CAMK protein kinase [Plasmodium inui San Antonio 1]EUD65514.1 CAMK protein kinase [Plasmodium inui San Antonio 1]